MKYSNNFAHAHAEGKSTWHIEWCTKYRCKIFKTERNKNLCIIALEEAAKRSNVVLLEREVEPEHVHAVAEVPLTIGPLMAVGRLKSFSAKIIFALRPKLRLLYPKGKLWSKGTFAISVGNITLEKAKEYVRNQRTHHAKFYHSSESSPAPQRGSARRLRACPEEEVNTTNHKR